jgi:hypothetical protein
MRPAEVLRMQADLAAALGPGQPAGAQLIETSENQEVVEGDNRDHVRQLCAAHVQHGRAFLITEHMSEVAQRRADDEQRIPPTTHCPTDIEPPRPAGFVVFEQPMVLPEIRGREQLCHVLTWGGALSRNPGTGRQHRGWLLTTWNDIARRPDQVVREAIAAVAGGRCTRCSSRTINASAWSTARCTQTSAPRWRLVTAPTRRS